jgi:hypothetical protein
MEDSTCPAYNDHKSSDDLASVSHVVSWQCLISNCNGVLTTSHDSCQTFFH